jgi:hypothetical protein
MTQAAIPKGILPPVATKTFCALKNTPEPITVPTTIQMAVINPYLRVSFSNSIPSYKIKSENTNVILQQNKQYVKNFIQLIV